MGKKTDNVLTNLKNVLLTLQPTGENGFEGLIAVVLAGITGVPFRLSSSGSQHGIDGRSVYETDSICFEAKRYSGKLSKKEITSKIAELAVNDNTIDLWVLGATTAISNQNKKLFCSVANKVGIAVLILDWSVAGLPPLATALALSKNETMEFLQQNIVDKSMQDLAQNAFEAITNYSGFNEHAERLKLLLNEPTIGSGLLKKANYNWLTSVFSDRRKARRFLGQPLAPSDNSYTETLDREVLIAALMPYLTERSDGSIIIVHGGEGTGKSWLVAQSWLDLDEKPMMLILTPEDLSASDARENIERILISKLISQTNDRSSERVNNRWHRQFERWRNKNIVSVPCLIVFVDGINQRPEMDWGLLLESIGEEVDKIGGRLIVTSRSFYYLSQIKQRLLSPTKEIVVSEWSEAELKEILTKEGVDRANLTNAVAKSLRNPRLLGIALDLQSTAKIEDFDELNVSRLLFEHIRASEWSSPIPQPAPVFARNLQRHADDILNRLRSQQHDDLTVFDHQLQPVAEGRFFALLESDPTRYTLTEDGLFLALGFSIIDNLRSSIRNRRDLNDSLQAMIEPIAALDKTADVIMAAITIAVLDENCSHEIAGMLIYTYTGLQNPNEEDFSAFLKFAKKKPGAYMHAAFNLCLENKLLSNYDWIWSALQDAKADDHVWAVMSDYIRPWLKYYSLSLDYVMPARYSGESSEEIEEKRRKRQNEINENLQSLSPAERVLLNLLTKKEDGNLSALANLAFNLMAGKSLTEFAESLIQWSFANALNPDSDAPYESFLNLVRLNRIDWHDTYRAIHEKLVVFEGDTISQTGKWALVALLRATGDARDAERAEALVHELTADRPKIEGWRLVEDYCASDPCDPKSNKPDNIGITAERYKALDVSMLRRNMGNTSEDHFFDMARAGLARFEPNVVIEKHIEFADHVAIREGLPLRQGIFEIRNHSSLLTKKRAVSFLNYLGGEIVYTDENNALLNHQIFPQFGMIISFSHLLGEEQLEALLLYVKDKNIMLKLCYYFKKIEKSVWNKYFNRAYQDNDDKALYLILTFALYSETPIPKKTHKNIVSLITLASPKVQTQALGLIAKLKDDNLIKVFLRTDWVVRSSDSEWNHWYGSEIIIQAAEREFITCDEALNRISPRLYSKAAIRLGDKAARVIARRIDASIRKTLDFQVSQVVPVIEQNDIYETELDPPLYNVHEVSTMSNDPNQFFEKLKETPLAFEERQKRNYDAFQAFKQSLTKSKAEIILDNIRMEAFSAIVAANIDIAENWYELFLKLPKNQLPVVHNLILLLANALGEIDPVKTKRLFTAISQSQPLIRFNFGLERVALDTISVWFGAEHEDLYDLRFERLDKASNDYELANEVLAAYQSMKHVMLERYVDEKLATGEPSMIARALMVAGFSNKSSHAESVLEKYKNTVGFIGAACNAAMYAYERNVWAMHWFERMCQAKSAREFWCNSVLFTKVVDGRYSIWRSQYKIYKKPFMQFGASINEKLKKRIEKWQTKRKKTLYGQSLPSNSFL